MVESKRGKNALDSLVKDNTLCHAEYLLDICCVNDILLLPNNI